MRQPPYGRSAAVARRPGPGVMLSNRRIIDDPSLAGATLTTMDPTALLASRLPKHVRYQLRYSPRDSCSGTRHNSCASIATWATPLQSQA